MAYWYAASQVRPVVAKMAMDFVSAPGESCLALSILLLSYF